MKLNKTQEKVYNLITKGKRFTLSGKRECDQGGKIINKLVNSHGWEFDITSFSLPSKGVYSKTCKILKTGKPLTL